MTRMPARLTHRADVLAICPEVADEVAGHTWERDPGPWGVWWDQESEALMNGLYPAPCGHDGGSDLDERLACGCYSVRPDGEASAIDASGWRFRPDRRPSLLEEALAVIAARRAARS